jgi:hypothetical protein
MPVAVLPSNAPPTITPSSVSHLILRQAEEVLTVHRDTFPQVSQRTELRRTTANHPGLGTKVVKMVVKNAPPEMRRSAGSGL